ncbi:MAG: SurA N-terminal domain-containing protein [Chromatiales bacterium]|jgi:peptidyl-prolyl cis-trans isomerase D|nr:SurA N-terminal domain-containing protein [Chromatiales bacterium]
MLKFIRDNAKGVVAWIIIIIIIVPFALWGVNQYFNEGGEVIVARVGDRKISQNEFQNQFQRELAMRRQMTNGAAADAGLKREVIDRMVNTAVVTRSAQDAGFRIPDARIGQRIHSMREFQQPDGRFDPDLYARVLASAGLTVSQFEDGMRSDMVVEQLISGFAETAFVTPHDLDTLLRITEQRRRFSYLVLPASDYKDRVHIDDERIAKYYDENRERFAVPERVSAQYIELSMPAIAAAVAVDQDTLHRLYEEQKSSFAVGEERHAHHILIAVDENADEAKVTAARQRAEALLAEIRSGKSFEAVARTNSDDSGSASSGGDLGFFTRDAMVGSFADAVFSMTPGELRGPVRSSFGFHIIRLDEVHPGSVPSFASLAAKLETDYRNAKAEERFFEISERLADLTFQHSDTLNVAAEELGLPIQRVDAFSADRGEGIAAESAFRDAAFSTDVLESGHNSSLVDLGKNRVVVVRVADRQPATWLPLAEVREGIKRSLIRDDAAALARHDGELIMERGAAGGKMEELAHEFHGQWHAEATVRRDDQNVNPQVSSAVFSMPRPAADTATYKGVELDSGDFAVVTLYEVIDGNPESVTAAERSAHEGAVTNFLGQLAVRDLLESLKERTKVKVFEDRL